MIHYVREINYNIITSAQATKILLSIRKGAENMTTDGENQEEYETLKERFRNQKTIRMKIQVKGEEIVIIANVIPSEKLAFIIGEETFQEITLIQFGKANRMDSLHEIAR